MSYLDIIIFRRTISIIGNVGLKNRKYSIVIRALLLLLTSEFIFILSFFTLLPLSIIKQYIFSSRSVWINSLSRPIYTHILCRIIYFCILCLSVRVYAFTFIMDTLYDYNTVLILCSLPILFSYNWYSSRFYLLINVSDSRWTGN